MARAVFTWLIPAITKSASSATGRSSCGSRRARPWCGFQRHAHGLGGGRGAVHLSMALQRHEPRWRDERHVQPDQFPNHEPRRLHRRRRERRRFRDQRRGEPRDPRTAAPTAGARTRPHPRQSAANALRPGPASDAHRHESPWLDFPRLAGRRDGHGPPSCS